MKIHNRLALLLLAAGLAACGNDLGGESKNATLSPTGAVITSLPVEASSADKASVGFNVIFPEQAGIQKAAINPTMSKVVISTNGACGNTSLELTPVQNTGVMNLGIGECSFVATAYDSFNVKLESTTTKGTLAAGANNVSLTFLNGPWLFVDPATNKKLPLTLTGGTILTGINLSQNTTTGARVTRWYGPDTDADGPTTNDLLGSIGSFPYLRALGTFSGGTSATANLLTLSSGRSDLTSWTMSYVPGQRVIKILGTDNVDNLVISPASYGNYHTSKVIDGTTIAGNIAELTVDSLSNVGSPSGSCFATASRAAETALTAALATAQKSATPLTGTVTATWDECINGQVQSRTVTYSNITIHPFRAKSVFADPAGAMQLELNNAISTYQKALTTEDPMKGLSLVLLRKAVSQFTAAANLAGNDLSNTAHTARFFGAISRLASLGIDTESDNVSDGLNDLNDVLDAFGADLNPLNRNWSDTSMLLPETCVNVTPPAPSSYTYQDCTPNLPATSPRSGELITLLAGKVTAQLDSAIADLSKIPAGFTYNFIDPVSNLTTNFDYGDVLALTAFSHGIKAELAIDMAYDLDLDIDAAINGSGTGSIEKFLLDNPTIGKRNATRYVAELTQAKADLKAGLTAMQSAINVIEAEGTGIEQEQEFISFYNVYYDYRYNAATNTYGYILIDSTIEDITEARNAIAKALAALDGPVMIDDKKTADTADDVYINASKFFAGISFRDLLPGFTGDEANSLFPDATMGGILVKNVNVNVDVDGNGVTDLLEEENFYRSLIVNKDYQVSTWFNMTGNSISWSGFRLNDDAGQSMSATWSYSVYTPPVYSPSYIPGYYTPYGDTATGTWQILTDGTLQITMISGAPMSITRMNFTLQHIDTYAEPNMPTGNQHLDVTGVATNSDATTLLFNSWWSYYPNQPTQPF